MKKIMKNNNGITLIALVITIIILIILAGVSINILFDNDGLINKAKKAAENMEIAAVEEQERLNEISESLENIGTSIKKEYAPYDKPYIPNGFTHTAGTWNSGYTITETATGNKFVWVPCVTDKKYVKQGDTVVTYGRTLPSTNSATDPYYKYNQNNYTITVEESPASDIRTSVETYGGFYIAAYEAGVPLNESGVEIEPTSATVTQKARSVAEAKAWTDISRTNAITAASNMIDSSVSGVNSGLISGEAWDTTLKWMVNASDNASNNEDYDINSTGHGWYRDVSADNNGNTAKTTTGKYPINNIYDMAGNVYEWTTENGTRDGNSCLIIRGGFSDNTSVDRPAASRSNIDGNSAGYIAFRVVLYKQVIPYDNPYIPNGFTHTTGTWNNGYTIKDELGNEFVWVPCVTDQKYVKQGDKVVTFGRILPSTTSATDPYYMYNNENLTIVGEESIADNIKISVEKYGGFYIAKYEAGVPVDSDNNEIEPTSATVTQKARSVAGAKVWTNITRANAILAAGNMIYTNDGVKSMLISGEAWDTTLQWMVKTSDNSQNEPNKGFDVNSTGNGRYEEENKTVTGQYPINNIYDMAGNVWEWTTENCSNNDKTMVLRGGYSTNTGVGDPACCRDGANGNGSPGFAFRVVLYK